MKILQICHKNLCKLAPVSKTKTMFIFDVTIWLKVVTFNYQQGEEESAIKNMIKIGLDNELNFSKEFSLCFRIIFKVIFF